MCAGDAALEMAINGPFLSSEGAGLISYAKPALWYHFRMACKWTFTQRVKLRGKDNLAKLLQFYLWETPVSGVSNKGKSFKEYGWEESNYATLHARMRRVSGFPNPKRPDWIVAAVKDVEAELAALGRLDDYKCSFEFAVHNQKDGHNKTEALFYLIRNAFAHGGFRINEYEGQRFYVFENRHDGKIKGRAIFQEKTLLSWIDIVRAGPR